MISSRREMEEHEALRRRAEQLADELATFANRMAEEARRLREDALRFTDEA